MNRIATLALALGGLTVLSACGNDPQIASSRAAVGNIFNVLFKNRGAGAPQPTPAELAAGALAATDEPVILIAREGGATGAMVRIGQNGAYDHFGTSSRQVLTLRDGMIAASRGFGNDLMSSDLGPSIALVSARKPGTARRLMRYLDGEDRTFTFEFTCTVTVGKSAPIQSGEIKATVTDVTEACESPSRSFRNVYKVDRSGRIVASSQWLAPLHGQLSVSRLR